MKRRPVRLVGAVAVALLVTLVATPARAASAAAVNAVAASSPSLLDDLPRLTPGERAGHSSSFDRTGGNDDSTGGLYRDAHGDRVLLDVAGAGVVHRMWFTGIDESKQLRVYFDGEAAPRLSMSLWELLRAGRAPFAAPLVANQDTSSGGYVSYVPLPFARSILITLTDYGVGYFNIDYTRSSPGTAVASWTGSEDLTALRTLWSTNGAQLPASGSTNAATVDVAAGSTATVYDADGPAQVSRLTLRPDQLSGAAATPPPQPGPQQPAGAGAGNPGSSFRIAIDPAADGVVLTRSTDRRGRQVLLVRVDGTDISLWPAPDGRDDPYPLPVAVTRNKAAVTVTLVRVAGDNRSDPAPRITAASQRGGRPTRTDLVDAGDQAGRAAHDYQAWTAPAPAPGGSAPTHSAATGTDPLATLRLQMFWDNEPTAGIDAPLNSLFQVGAFGARVVPAVAAGRSPDGTLYLNLPMPFARHATMRLVNTGTTAAAVEATVTSAPYAGNFADVGYLRTQYRETTAQLGSDVVLLDAAGAGKLVGIVESVTGTADNWFLEGDERATPDGIASPTVHGTGTEDFYNGGWYFDRGPYTGPVSGNTAHFTDAAGTHVAAYRDLLTDPVPFDARLRFTIEHGAVDEADAEFSTLAYYYAQPQPRLEPTDLVAVTGSTSVADHQYTATGQVARYPLSATFEGENDRSVRSGGVQALRGISGFTVAVDPANAGVLLRRTFDQQAGRQNAVVAVDGVPVSEWNSPGANDTHRWREEDLFLPSAVTAGRPSVRITVDATRSPAPWSESSYAVYSLAAGPTLPGAQVPVTASAPSPSVGVGQDIRTDVVAAGPDGATLGCYDGPDLLDTATIRSGRASCRDGALRPGVHPLTATLLATPTTAPAQSGAAVVDVVGADPVRDRFVQAGGLAGLGLPSTPPYPVADGVEQRFARGEVLWSPQTGAHLVEGAIRGRLDDLGGPGPRWERLAIGFPTTDEIDVPGGRASLFPTAAIYWAPGLGAHEVTGAIYDSYQALGGPGGVLGQPRTGELGIWGPRYNEFGDGGVYWTPATGAREVQGRIFAEYVAQGGPLGFLGTPLTDELPTPFEPGRFNHFAGGSIYWSAATGAHEVHGSIRAKWADLGWEHGLAGFPTTAEYAVPGGRASSFEHTVIYWSAPSGAHEVHGAISAAYMTTGGSGGPLGLPSTDELPAPDGVGRYGHFSGGSVYWSPATGAHEVYGAIRAAWAASGWELGLAGYPVSGEYAVAGGRASNFEHAVVYWSPATGAHEVHGAILADYLASGGPAGRLGFPRSDEYAAPGGRASDFTGGRLTWTPATGVTPG